MEFTPDPVPVQQRDGVLYVGESRVPLAIIVDAYEDGQSPERIVEQFDTLSLSQVYSSIGFYLSHRGELDAALDVEAHAAEALRRSIEEINDSSALRAILLARKAAMRADASTSR
jgi:uncharacterized protein (DUF433 family)